jgi:hypothetical protein
VQRRRLTGINRGAGQSGGPDIVDQARDLGELEDILQDARVLLAEAADAQQQQAQVAAAQEGRTFSAAPITAGSWGTKDRTPLAAGNGHRPAGYACVHCRKPIREPDEDDDGECYFPNCGVLLTNENCLKAEDLDSLPPKPRPDLSGGAR